MKKNNANEPKTKWLTIRLTPKEYKHITDVAKKAKYSVSDYCRTVLFSDYRGN